MGQLERLKETKQRAKPKASTTTKQGGFVLAYKPNKEEVEDIRNSQYNLTGALRDLAYVAELGHKLSIGYNVDKEGFYALLRDGDSVFPNGVAVSAWGGSIEKCLIALGYYVSVVNREFPNGVQRPMPLFEDW